MGTPICGVLLLDPSRHSPLELVKSRGACPVHRDGIHTVRTREEPRQLTAEDSPQICSASSQRTCRWREHRSRSDRERGRGATVSAHEVRATKE